jgi:hypothetical protein
MGVQNGMFDFKPSTALVVKIIENVKTAFKCAGLSPPDNPRDMELIRSEWGRTVMRHLCSQSIRSKRAGSAVLNDGKFPPKMANSIGGQLCIFPGEEGDALIVELAEELLQYIVEHPSSSQGTITRFEIKGRNVIAHVRPQDTLQIDTGLVHATEVV